MDMTGEQRIPLPRQQVWEALNNPEILKACIAGCESIDRVTDTEYKVAMTVAIGPVKAKFAGKLLLSDLDPPRSYALAFEGSGGAAGFGKGGAKVRLAEDGSATVLSYEATASVGGKLAQIGSRLIDGVARKMAEDFFVRFNATVAPPMPPGAAAEVSTDSADAVAALAAADAAGASGGQPPGRPAPRGGIPSWVWIAAAVGIAAIVYFARGH